MRVSPAAPANGTDPAECENGDVRLLGGSSANEGRVELCFHGHWGTVCSDTWDSADAEVVCGELGFKRSGKLAPGPGYNEAKSLHGSQDCTVSCT